MKRRLLFACIWFWAFFLGTSLVAGVAVRAQAGKDAPCACKRTELRMEAVTDLFKTSGVRFLLGAAASALAGTATGILPGTQRPARGVSRPPAAAWLPQAAGVSSEPAPLCQGWRSAPPQR